jgi:hypothetical protein
MNEATEKSGTLQRARHSGQYRPGQSGNPAGRPVGSGLTGELRRAIARHAADVVDVLVQRAKDGDVGAARALLDRVVPALKAELLSVQVPDLATGTLAERAESAFRAVGAGEIAPDTGAALVSALGALARIQELTEIEARLQALEEKSYDAK